MHGGRFKLGGWPALVVVVTLLIGLSGCASGPDDGSSTYGDNGSSSGTESTSGSDTGKAGTDTSDKPTKKPKKKPKRNVIKWTLGLGVGSPEGPASDYLPSYTALSEGNCGAADDNEQNESLKYVVAAAKACQAAKGQSVDPAADWATAKEVRDNAEEPLGCVDAVVFLVLDSLVDAHEKHPERQFSFEPGTSSKGKPRCPEITRVEPGEASGGEVVALRGVNLGDVTGVTLNGASVEVVKTEDSSVEVRVPEGQSDTVDLVVESPRNQWQLVAHLEIQPGPGEGEEKDQSPSDEPQDGSGSE